MSAACLHCGDQVADGAQFCCRGCAGAFELIKSLGLGRFYERRAQAGVTQGTQPEDGPVAADPSAWVVAEPDGTCRLSLMVDGLQCGACVWLIEQSLLQEPGVELARVSLSTRRLTLAWRKGVADPVKLIDRIQRLGYRLVPFDPRLLQTADDMESKALLRAIAVAGFAAGNIMLLSVSVWAGGAEGMAAGTRDLFHWISALIAIPAIAYAGRPFFQSAWQAIRNRRTNMDVPISLAVILAPGISLIETFRGGEHAYFDSAVTLLFFLLIGRYLDRRVRARARLAVEQMTALNATAATVVDQDGRTRDLPPTSVLPGMRVLVSAGGRVPVDGVIESGASDLDLSILTGESAAVARKAGDEVFAGAVNLTGPLRIVTRRSGGGTLLADIIGLMEAAETRRGRYVRIADRVARYYAPVVHSVALLAFLGWILFGGLGWQPALLIAISVLIITCPCALALAIPAVQVAASQRLMRAGILLKAGDALERLHEVDYVVFDKTGTLTTGELRLPPDIDPDALATASAIAAHSRHPLARAIRRGAPQVTPKDNVKEIPGSGLEAADSAGTWRLGSHSFVGVPDDGGDAQSLWLASPGRPPVRFEFADDIRPDAGAAIQRLRAMGCTIEICSGDRPASVGAVAAKLGVGSWRGGMRPADKVAHLEELRSAGRRVLMVGDGLNDAPALAAAHVSIAPASGTDVTQSAADIVFQGVSLSAVPDTLALARKADRLMRQNLSLALIYNLAAVPLAVVGYVTPLIAALAMSSSSILVILNALRLGRIRLS
ncbi:MAG: heavy metal translocating P-type ATPase metal-binding domain-containing protein [Dongiaceae bacterium]